MVFSKTANATKIQSLNALANKMSQSLTTNNPLAHTDAQMQTNTPDAGRTVRYWCGHYQKREASVMKAVRRKYGTGMSLDTLLSDEQVSVIFGSDNRRAKTRTPRTASPSQKRATEPDTDTTFDIAALRNIVFDITCIAIVVGHAALIWYDCTSQWGTPGLIGGSIAFLIVMAALLVSTDASRVRTSASALWFVFFVDAAAWFVHFPTFQQYADIGDIETGAFAAFLCLFSWVALYLYRDSKID